MTHHYQEYEEQDFTPTGFPMSDYEIPNMKFQVPPRYEDQTIALTTPRELLLRWAAHIKDVYARRGRGDVYTIEVMHTCHGCGGCAGPAANPSGLCGRCQHDLASCTQEPNATTLPKSEWIE